MPTEQERLSAIKTLYKLFKTSNRRNRRVDKIISKEELEELMGKCSDTAGKCCDNTPKVDEDLELHHPFEPIKCNIKVDEELLNALCKPGRVIECKDVRELPIIHPTTTTNKYGQTIADFLEHGAQCSEAVSDYVNKSVHINMDFAKGCSTFTKHDSNKLDIALIPAEAIEAIARVMMHGAKEYGRNNWKNATKCDIVRYYNALQRHLLEVHKGNMVDCDSGYLHLEHAICNLAFLIWHYKHGTFKKIEE